MRGRSSQCRPRPSRLRVLGPLLALVAAPCCSTPDPEPAPGPASRPNFLLIVADDLGYTDLGVYGGEIGTPHIDALARGGVMFTDFHAASTCSPTRAMLLSGVDNHLAGLGTMAGDHVGDQLGAPGYETYLNFRVAALPELLRDAGYRTLMSGKWHLGTDPDVGPAARGFERSFALLGGGGGHFSDSGLFSADRPARYVEDGEPVTLPEDFYSTRYYADKMIEYLGDGEGKDDGRPFFAYLAFTAPHWPLQAPAESVALYRGRYDAGYDVLFEERLAALARLGLIDGDVAVWPRLPGEPAWEELGDDERRVESRKMEIYAAMVHDLDVQVGRVLEHLRRSGAYEDTWILFLSDNGAEGHRLQQTWPHLRDWIEQCCDNSYANMGRGDSYVDYGPNWARAGIGPFRLFKGFATEGALRVPAIVSWPGHIEGGRVGRAFATVLDVAPTVLELAGVEHPGTRYREREILPFEGRSLWPYLSGAADTVHGDDFVMGWELFGRRALRRGNLKLTWTTSPYGPDAWELFDLAADPGETRDLSGRLPEVVRELGEHWERYVVEKGVVLSDEPLAY